MSLLIPKDYTPNKGTLASSISSSASSASSFFSSISVPSTDGIKQQLSTVNVYGSLLKIIAYLGAIIVVILIILLFIHYFVTPIFVFKPGNPGIIQVPGFDDGQLFWSDGTTPAITDGMSKAQSYGYSLILDMFIQNPYIMTGAPRILFRRGATARKTHYATASEFSGVVDNYNLIIGLVSNNTDLIVSVLCNNNGADVVENLIIPNIPIQTPFRIGVVIMQHALEVYINDKLSKTKSLMYTPKDVKGEFNTAFIDAGEQNIAKLRNLKIWNRILTSSEIKYATPALSTVTEFAASPMPLFVS